MTVATTRRRRWALALMAPLVVAGALAAWLLRDPVDRIRDRHGTLVEATVEPLDPIDGPANGLDNELSNEDTNEYANERIRLRSSSGLRGELLLRRPVAPVAPVSPVSPVRASPGEVGDQASAAQKRRPVFLILGGYATGERAATLIDDTGGNIVVAMAYPYDGDLRVKGLAVVPAVPRIRQAILDTPPAVLLALDYLLSRPDVDPARVELVGASFGTPFATVAGALDPRVSRVWSVHGAGEPYTLIEHNLAKSIPWRPARVVVAGLATLLASGPRLAPERWAPRIAPREFIMINASEDERLPRAAITTLFDSAREPKELIWLPGMHVQSNRTEILQGLVRTVLERAAGQS